MSDFLFFICFNDHHKISEITVESRLSVVNRGKIKLDKVKSQLVNRNYLF